MKVRKETESQSLPLSLPYDLPLYLLLPVLCFFAGALCVQLSFNPKSTVPLNSPPRKCSFVLVMSFSFTKTKFIHGSLSHCIWLNWLLMCEWIRSSESRELLVLEYNWSSFTAGTLLLWYSVFSSREPEVNLWYTLLYHLINYPFPFPSFPSHYFPLCTSPSPQTYATFAKGSWTSVSGLLVVSETWNRCVTL